MIGLFGKKKGNDEKESKLEEEVETQNRPTGFGKPVGEDYLRLYDHVRAGLGEIMENSPSTTEANGMVFVDKDDAIHILYEIKFNDLDGTIDVAVNAQVYSVFTDKPPAKMGCAYAGDRISKEKGVVLCKPTMAVTEINNIIAYRKKKGLDKKGE